MLQGQSGAKYPALKEMICCWQTTTYTKYPSPHPAPPNPVLTTIRNRLPSIPSHSTKTKAPVHTLPLHPILLPPPSWNFNIRFRVQFPASLFHNLLTSHDLLLCNFIHPQGHQEFKLSNPWLLLFGNPFIQLWFTPNLISHSGYLKRIFSFLKNPAPHFPSSYQMA